jgi:hypothetical protein
MTITLQRRMLAIPILQIDTNLINAPETPSKTSTRPISVTACTAI